MSAPAAKAFSEPVMTMQPTALSRSKRSMALLTSPISCPFSAFSACGRFSVMTPTAPFVSTMMVS